MGTLNGLREGLDLLARGLVKAHVDKTFPMSDVAAAHRYIESRAVKGKVVLIP